MHNNKSEEKVINLYKGFNSATFIVENHKDNRGRYIICASCRDDSHYWVNDGTDVFDPLRMPKTYGSNLERAQKLVQEINANNGILNAEDFKRFLSVNSDIKSYALDKITEFNYPETKEEE
jgi:hypothetical protein